MAYLRYYDPRYGDLYEIYYNEESGDFEGAFRSAGGIVGNDPIYYSTLNELPIFHRDKVEQLIWTRTHPPPSSSQRS